MMASASISDLSSSQSPGAAPLLRKKAVFLDRDGTLIRHHEYLTDLCDVELLDGTSEALRLLNQRQIPAVVITNQSAVARGLLNEEQLRAIHLEIEARLRSQGAHVDAFYYCPHHPATGVPPYRRRCACRKPEPGLIFQASDELGISPRMSFMVGDSEVDIRAGRRAGCRTVLISAESAAAPESPAPGRPDRVAPDVLQAVHWILGEIE